MRSTAWHSFPPRGEARDEHLRAIGIDLLEPLLDCHHEEIFEAFLSEAERNWKLRTACSSAWTHIPAEKAILFRNLIAHDPERRA